MKEELDWICQNCGKIHYLNCSGIVEEFDEYPPPPIKCNYCGEKRKERFENMIIKDSKGTKLPFIMNREKNLLWVRTSEREGTFVIDTDQIMETVEK